MDYRLLMDTAVLAGEIMLKSGAETYRAEDTMAHILKVSGLEKVETYVTMTGIMAMIDDASLERPYSVINRVDTRGTYLDRVMKVNDISRRYCAGELSLEEANTLLKKVEEKQYSIKDYNIAIILITVGFAMFFGGGMKEVLGAGIVGIVEAFLITLCKRLRFNTIIHNIVTSAGIAGASYLIFKLAFLKMDMDIVIISAIMPLVPGVAITNAIRDTLQGDYLSGSARMLEAFVKASTIALGIGLGLAVCGKIF